MRLKSGRIRWYNPRFLKKTEESWKGVLDTIRSDEEPCTPILGPGMTESLLGPHHELARRWAIN